MKTFALLLAVAVLPRCAAAAACPDGQMAVGDDSERGYKCVPRTTSDRPSLKAETPATDKQGDQAADAGQAAKPTEPTGVQEKPLGRNLKIKKREPCPKGWKRKGEGCAAPKASK